MEISGDDELLKIAAIHEAGHVLLAYLYGLKINSVVLETLVPGEGVTSISWGKDQKTISILTKPIFRDERRGLLMLGKNNLLILANKFIGILCAGTAAEGAYEMQQSGTSSINSINGMDNDQIADFVDALAELEIIISDEDILKRFRIVYGILSQPEYFSSILKLAEKILESNDRSLNADELANFFSKLNF